MNPLKGCHFTGVIILWAVRSYCKYGIIYREVQEMSLNTASVLITPQFTAGFSAIPLKWKNA